MRLKSVLVEAREKSRILQYCSFFIKKTKLKAEEKKFWSEPSKCGDIKKFKNAYMGKRCFIVATGPSLTVDDLLLISNEISFGMNSRLMNLADRFNVQDREIVNGVSSASTIEWNKVNQKIEEYSETSRKTLFDSLKTI